LRDAHHFDHRRSALAVCKTRGLFLVGVHAAELFAVGIGYGHQKMMMAPPLVLIERRFAPLGGFI